ncbi:unnamed protein product [Penicillium pancosmium]
MNSDPDLELELSQSINEIPLCASCAGILSQLPAHLLQPPDPETKHGFSYTTDLFTLQRDGACDWCIELAAAVNEYECPEKLAHTQLTISMEIWNHWRNDPASRHTLMPEIRVENIAFSRRSYELFYYASSNPVLQATSTQTTITHMFQQCTTLMNTCSTHSDCHSGHSSLPTRVLDVWANKETGNIHICETNGLLRRTPH